jgi:PHD/YefM family antitoxin component YafN of YafNO toxin-antitoxin module
MVTETTYAQATADLDGLCERVAEEGELVIVRREGAADVALIAGSELSGLIKALDLLRSPRNAAPLLTALRRARERAVDPAALDAIRRELLEPAD